MLWPSTTPGSKQTLAPAWLEARARIRAPGFADADAFGVLAELVDSAGAAMQKLQDLVGSDPALSQGLSPWAQLLTFIDGDLTDVMRGVSLDAACLIPGEGWLDRADPVETEGDVDLLVRYLEVALLAAEHRSVPGEAKQVFREVGGEMEGWGPRITASIDAIAREFLVGPRGSLGATGAAPGAPASQQSPAGMAHEARSA